MNKKCDLILPIYAWFCGVIIIMAFMSVIGYLIYYGISVINLKLIFGTVKPIDALLLRRVVFGALFSSIVGTIMLVICSISIAIPLGVFTGIYLAEYAGFRTKAYFDIIYDILSGLPSIVIGLFGFSATIFLHNYFSSDIYPCLLISAFSLAVLVLPYIIRTTQTSINNLSSSVHNTATALGATKLQNIIYVLLPQSISGIFSGIVLAIGRCAEDTAVIMLTGVAATAGIPKSFFHNYEALPFYIYHISSNYRNTNELATGYGAAIILLIICMSLFFVASIIKAKIEHIALYRS